MSELTIDITCPVCTTVFKKKARELTDGSTIQCPKCGEKTTIKGSMFTDMVTNIEKSGKTGKSGNA
jgi:uncharacterized protein (DUF2225 family)